MAAGVQEGVVFSRPNTSRHAAAMNGGDALGLRGAYSHCLHRRCRHQINIRKVWPVLVTRASSRTATCCSHSRHRQCDQAPRKLSAPPLPITASYPKYVQARRPQADINPRCTESSLKSHKIHSPPNTPSTTHENALDQHAGQKKDAQQTRHSLSLSLFLSPALG